jgi:hypothetical protein
MRSLSIESLDHRDLLAANALSDVLVPPAEAVKYKMFAIIDRTPFTVPSNNTLYIGSANGGVWKTSNAGGGYEGNHALYQDILIPNAT